MNLKPRPISEAPKNQWLLTRTIDGQNVEFAARWYRHEDKTCDVRGTVFWTTAELLRAAENWYAITPVGYKYCGNQGYAPPSKAGGVVTVGVMFKPIAPPVEYEYVTDGKVKRCESESEEYIFHDGKFALFRDCGGGAYPPQLHYRRVEVKP